jgi:hypothetical protein
MPHIWSIFTNSFVSPNQFTSPGQRACIDASHRVHARVEDAIRTGEDWGIGKYLSTSLVMNTAWQAAAPIASTLVAWLKLLALDGTWQGPS